MKKTLFIPLGIILLMPFPGVAQRTYWQQHVDYRMDVKMNVETNRLAGTQRLVYSNNSPDTLYKVFYHLYWNAFQPGSMMDVRSRELGKIILGVNQKGDTIRDWDSRVRDRILHLQPDETGYDSVTTLKMNGRPQQLIYHETILEVRLDKPILPHARAVFDLRFKCQVPVQIRRSGRDNAEGVRYSMSQWYPKLCEYDFEGWHPTPYVGREFYGVWGNYDVKITIDKDYILGGTGYLQNAQQIGFGYETPGSKVPQPKGEALTWHFNAPDVHDFMWAADPGYKHLVERLPDGRKINFLYKPTPHTDSTWSRLAWYTRKALPFMEKTFGKYAFSQYSFIQGGDGGMEYPMGTLIVGNGSQMSLLGTALHEWMHSWYQMMLATNESMYPWMDEGFTSYAEARVMQYLMDSTESELKLHPYANAYRGYFNLVRSGREEPMTTHADHYETNYAYGMAAYAKGAVFLEQLGYITGDKVRDQGLLEYYKHWSFRHPEANDFIRVMEKVSGMKLDWYLEYFTKTTKTIDYGIDVVKGDNGATTVTLRRIGYMPMPIDLLVTFKDGSREMIYIPVDLMYGVKPDEDPSLPRKILLEWPWTNPTYTFILPVPAEKIGSLEIDPSERMADVNRGNNRWEE